MSLVRSGAGRGPDSSLYTEYTHQLPSARLDQLLPSSISTHRVPAETTGTYFRTIPLKIPRSVKYEVCISYGHGNSHVHLFPRVPLKSVKRLRPLTIVFVVSVEAEQS